MRYGSYKSSRIKIRAKKYLDLAETEEVVVKRGSKLIYLVVKERSITDEDLKHGITGEELLDRIRPRIKSIFQL